MGTLGRFVFWDFARASWQYDVMVGVILAFIFLTPRDFFKDQPKPASIVMLSTDQTPGQVYWLEPSLMNGVPQTDFVAKASSLVNARFKTHRYVTKVEPVFDDEQEIIGYRAFAGQ